MAEQNQPRDNQAQALGIVQNPMPTHPEPQNLPVDANLAQVTTLTLESEEPLVQMKQHVSVDELEWWQGYKPMPLEKVERSNPHSCLVATY